MSVTTAVILKNIKSSAEINEEGPLTVEGNIGSSAQITLRNGPLIAHNISSSVTIKVAKGDITVKGNISSSTKITADNGRVNADTVGQSAKITATGDVSAGSMSSSAKITATGNVTVSNMSSNAKIKSGGSTIVHGDIGSSAQIIATKGKVTVRDVGSSAKIRAVNGGVSAGDISSGATIILESHNTSLIANTIASGVTIQLNNGLLDIKNSIPTNHAGINSGNSNTIYRNGVLVTSSGSEENISKIIDAAMGLNIEIRQNRSSGQVRVFVNGHEMPEEFTKSLSIHWENRVLLLNGQKVDATHQGLWINGQLVIVEDVVQSIPPQPAAPYTGYNIESNFSGGPAFLAAPTSPWETSQKTNENAPLLQKSDADNERCCCAVM
jgi:hypothetical protein